MQFLTIHKNNKVGVAYLPELAYAVFYEQVLEYLQNPANYIVSYYGVKKDGRIKMFCAIANDDAECVYLAGYSLPDEPGIVLESVSQLYDAAYPFEQKIVDSMGVHFNFSSVGQSKGELNRKDIETV